jgi:hypothetical protein
LHSLLSPTLGEGLVMADTVDMGVPGVQLDPGDHVCAFYFGTAERDKVLIPFLQAGLQGGDKCIAVFDYPEPKEMVARLGDDAQSCVTTHQLELKKSAETYLQTGSFSAAQMVDYYEEFVSAAIDDGYPFARVTGEAGWVLDGPPGADEFIEYESQLNDFAPRYPQVIMCLYDLERFGGGMIVDVLKTHKKLLLGGLVLDNPHYLTPDEFRATRS